MKTKIKTKKLSNINFAKPNSVFSIEKNTSQTSTPTQFLTQTPNDPINHPSHYTDGKVEVIDYIEDKKLDYYLGNVVKYISRAGKKENSNYIQDLKKAQWYLNRKIELLTKSTLLILLLTLTATAQITLENSYTGNTQAFRISETEFVYGVYNNQQINIYSSNHSLLHNIPISAPTRTFYINSITKTLFNSDTDLEITYSYYDSLTYIGTTKTIKPTGSVLFQEEGIATFFKQGSTSKMILNPNFNNTTSKVYSLPGELFPNSVGKKESTKNENPFPNPASTFINIPYHISENSGSLILFNANGKEIANYTINGNENITTLNTSQFIPGIYFYKTVTGNSQSIINNFIIN